VADPWSSDFAALGERTRHRLPALSSLSQPQETKMRFFKTHPALAALTALVVLAALSGAAYAVVRELWVSIDTDKSAPEIERDVGKQLEAAGVTGTVHAEKSDDGKQTTVEIHSMDPNMGSGLHIAVGGRPAETCEHSMRLEVTAELDPAAMQALHDAASSPEMIAVLKGDYPSDDDRAAAIEQILADRGFHGVEVHVDGGAVTVRITAPPS
jgi:hypothetical protein